MLVEDQHKAVGLDLSKPHGTQAEGLCTVGLLSMIRMGLEKGHSRQAIVIPFNSCVLQVFAVFVFKCLPLMMNALVLDVVADHILVT